MKKLKLFLALTLLVTLVAQREIDEQTLGVDQIVNSKSSNRKLMIDGHLYILRDGKIFTIHGAEVK